MNIGSCDVCGVVLDLNKMDYSSLTDKYGNELTVGCKSYECPLCSADITVTDEDDEDE